MTDERFESWALLALLVYGVGVLALSGCASMSTPEKFAAGAVALDVGTTAYAGYAGGFEETNTLFGSEIDTQLIVTGAAASLGAHFLFRYLARRFDFQAVWWGYGAGRTVAGLRNALQLAE